MILYHGSPIGNLNELKPLLSEHQKPYVYLTSNPVVALLYAVKPVPKPFSFYPYGFEGNKVVYSEYYKDCFKDLYKGKKGFLYECENPQNTKNLTAINCAYTCEKPVKVKNCTVINDLYEKLMEYNKNGLFVIKTFENIGEKELNFVYDDMKKTISQHNLRNCEDSPMSQFIVAHFPKVWLEL